MRARDDTRAHRLRRSPPARPASSSARARGTVDDEIEAVEQRTRELVAIASQPLCGARALCAGIAARTARAEIHRPDQLEPRRKAHAARRARDDELAVLERLAQRLECGTLELRELVEQQHAAMREARLTRAQPRSAADDRRRRRAVVRRAKRRVADQRMVRDRRAPRPSGCASPRAPAPPRAAAGSPAAAARASSCPFPAARRAGGCDDRPRRARAHGGRAPGRARRRGRAAGRRGLPLPTRNSGGSSSPRRYATASARWRTPIGSTPASAASAQASYGQMTRSSSGATRSFGHRQHAADPAQAPVERELAARRVLGEPCSRESGATRRAARARSADRSPSPPSSAPPEQG